MRYVSLFVVMILSLCLVSGCKKGGGGSGGGGTTPPPPTPTEADLVVSLNPASGSVQAPALGPFSVTVSITSTMPANGVKIEISAKKDDGSGAAPYFTVNENTTATTKTYNITNTPVNVQCLVEVKVTSLTKATNVWTGSYRYSSK